MTGPARLLLVRHGETDWNRERRLQGQSDVPLNEEGRRQIRALAARLAGSRVDAIHASDLARAAESARILGDALGKEPVLSADWREIHLGDMEGRGGMDLTRELAASAAHAARPIASGGESFAEVRARLLSGFSRIARDHAGGTVLLVGHGGTLKGLIALLIGLPPERIDALSLRSNGSLSAVDFRDGRAQLTLLNDTCHLGGQG
jgi:broad specificity phosphatase PhoE